MALYNNPYQYSFGIPGQMNQFQQIRGLQEKMLAALEEHLDELTTEMSDMSKDAECREERDLVKRYVEKLRDML